MLKRRLAAALSCAALLLASAPSAALAQAQKAAAAERNLTAPLPAKRPELNSLFAGSASRARAAGALTAADFRRFEGKRWQDDAQPPPPKEKWSKGTKIFVVVLVASIAAVCVWAIANPGDDPLPDCFNDPSNTLCN